MSPVGLAHCSIRFISLSQRHNIIISDELRFFLYVYRPRRDHVERKLEEWRRAMEERGLKISRRKTEYLGCNEHQDEEIHLQGETVKRVKTFTYLGSTFAGDG